MSLAPAEAGAPVGMFALWAQDAHGADQGGREATLRRWETRLHLPPSTLLAMDFYGGSDSASLDAFAWLPGYWKARNPDRRLIWSLPLAFKGASLAEVAAGARDADYARAAQAIAKAQPDAIIRLGWEMNGDWYPWAAGGREALYNAAYRRVAGLFKAASPRFIFVWCVNLGRQSSDAEAAWPGDDVVDSVGLDLYDAPAGGLDAEARWRADRDGPYGFGWLERFAAAHGKSMSLPEWGVGLRGAPDNAFFVDQVADWLAAHAGAVAFAAYFNAPPSRLDGGQFPQALAAYVRRFSAP